MRKKISLACKRYYANGGKHYPMSKEARIGLSKKRMGSLNPMWKGNEVGYSKLHAWVRIYKPQKELCESCQKVPPYDLANKGTYDRNFENWEWLCRRCHMKEDGRLKRFMYHSYKLTEKKVKEIRKAYAEYRKEKGGFYKKIIKKYRISSTMIYMIIKNKAWKQIEAEAIAYK